MLLSLLIPLLMSKIKKIIIINIATPKLKHQNIHYQPTSFKYGFIRGKIVS